MRNNWRVEGSSGSKRAVDLVTGGDGTCSDSGRHGPTHRGAAARAAISVGRRPAGLTRSHAIQTAIGCPHSSFRG